MLAISEPPSQSSSDWETVITGRVAATPIPPAWVHVAEVAFVTQVQPVPDTSDTDSDVKAKSTTMSALVPALPMLATWITNGGPAPAPVSTEAMRSGAVATALVLG
jgi:hypothetical protein